MMRYDKKLYEWIEKLENEIKLKDEIIKDLQDFIKRNGIVCPDCGYSGLDCHNYQG